VQKEDKILIFIFLLAFLALTVVIKFSMPLFRPVIIESKLFFQLLLAASVIALLRNGVGIATYGLFGPAIVAFALLGPGPVWGLALFANVAILAVMVRFIIDPLALSTSYRIAVIIAIFGIFVSLMEIVGELYHMNILEASLLFPALITSWMVDRFVNETKEVGWKDPVTKLIVTFVVIFLSYLVISQSAFVIWFIENPEMWVVLVGANLLLATGIRIRLMEYVRFGPLFKAGEDVLTMNVRNSEYIEKYNPRNLHPNLDKAEMKKTMHGLGIPTPETFMLVSDRRQISKATAMLSEMEKFVIKPNRAYGGEGIIVVRGRKGEQYDTNLGERPLNDLTGRIIQIMDGQYSNRPTDTAIIEELIVMDPFFEKICYGGVPDIRVIVFKGFPVMSMTRLTTKQSGGEANLHKGAVGVGLDIATGKAIRAYSNKLGVLKRHPDTGAALDGFAIPAWKDILRLAVKGHYASRLGYSGVDIVIDKRKGLMILEVNKRPGMGIQNTNRAGLLKRLKFIEERLPETEHLPAERKIELVMEWSRQWE
jgi:alpha-L-glutamate ligase-like protein